MKQRCTNPKHKDYPKYGGRGIKVCAGWMYFENFLAYMGEKPAGMSIERIDSNGDYEPSNCKWGTALEQANNRSICRKVNYDGVEYPSLASFCRAYNIDYAKFRTSLRNSTITETIERFL